jgi:hypothetical protein
MSDITVNITEEPITCTVVGDTYNITVPPDEPIGVTVTSLGGVGIPSGGTAGQYLKKTSDENYDMDWVTTPSPSAEGVDKDVQFNDAGNIAGNANFKFDKNSNTLSIGIPDALPDNPLALGKSIDSWVQANINNTCEGERASCDWVATADNGTDSTNYMDMGIDSSIYASDDYPFYEPNDGYIQGEVPRIIINPIRDGSSIEFVTGGSDTINHRATIDEDGLTMVAGHIIKIGTEEVAVVTNRPEVFYGTGDPPSATGLADGTLFFKYA